MSDLVIGSIESIYCDFDFLLIALTLFFFVLAYFFLVKIIKVIYHYLFSDSRSREDILKSKILKYHNKGNRNKVKKYISEYRLYLLDKYRKDNFDEFLKENDYER